MVRMTPGVQTPLEKAIWFIESHFSQSITLDDLARVCGRSRFQMSRLFSLGMGKTVTAYVRGRRLSEAARALAEGAPISSMSRFRPATIRMRLSHAPSGTNSGSLQVNSGRAVVSMGSRW